MSSPDSFRTARWIRTINLVLQAVLFLTLFGGLNYLARNLHWRRDLTQHRSFSLSPETLSYLRQLDRPVQIVATVGDDHENTQVRGLLREYANASRHSESGASPPSTGRHGPN